MSDEIKWTPMLEVYGDKLRKPPTVQPATIDEKIADLDRRLSRLESNVVRNYGPITAEPAKPMPSIREISTEFPTYTTPFPSLPSIRPTPPAGWPAVTLPALPPGAISDVCKPGGCVKIGCEGGYYCYRQDGSPIGRADPGATLAKVFGHGGPFGEDGALLAQGYSECQ
jgi:hypothetical protein